MSDTPSSGRDAAADAPDAHASEALAPLPWQRAVFLELVSRRDRWPHALLFTGPAGIGKRVFAQALARALLCESPAAEATPCGVCASCRYAAAGQHPDLRIVEPVEQDGDDTKAVEWITVDRIRAVTRWAELTSHRGGAKVALIVPAERMHPSAANALLKTLEEPPAGTHFLLVSQQPDRLPATIVSRCQRIAAPRPTADEAREWLAARGLRDVEPLIAQANGAPLLAYGLAGAGYQRERRDWLTALAEPRSLPVMALGLRVEAGPREGRRERLAAAIDWLETWCTDLARVRVGSAPARNPDFGTELAALAPSVAAVPLFRYHRSLLHQRALLAHPLQPRLVAEALLIDYRALFG